MRLSEAELRRVKRRIGLLWPRVIGLGAASLFLVLLLATVLINGKDKRGRPLPTAASVIYGLGALALLGFSAYYLPGAIRQYVGLLRDTREQIKDTMLAALKDKQEVMWNTGSGSFYYLVFDFGRVEVGKVLYEKARRGHLLTLVLSTHGRELLSVSEVEMKPISS
jgi:hypothetical protein